MAIEKVRTLVDGTAHYSQTTPLDGQNFVLHFDFNSRENSWYLSIHDSDDVPIRGAVGRKVVTDYALLLRSFVDARPPGEVLVVSGTQGDPRLEDLGDGVQLLYVPAADVDASIAAGAP